MAKEVLELEIKSNTKAVTKETKDWGKSLDNVNKSIEVQEKVLNDLEKELIQLKAKQDSIPKGAWYAGMDDLNKKIKKTETNIKLEKNALKGLKLEQKEASKEVKKFNQEQKETDKALEGTIGNLNVMGVSLNGIKSAMGKIIPAAKAMFSTITAGILSTGVGALLIAFGALMTYFTSTKKGADQLKVAFTAIGATVDVLKDRISTFGGAIVKVFKGDIKGAMQDVKGITKGVVDEIKEEVKIMTQLEKASQRLRDAEMEFSIQKAKTRQEIEKARLAAEDESLSAAVRLENLKKALALEEETTNKELELAEEAVRIQELQMAQSENLVEDEKKLADLKVALIEKETASVKMRRRVMTEVNTFEREILAEEKARAKEKQDIIDEENKRIADEKKKADDAKAAADKKAADAEIAEAKRVADEKIAILKAEENFKKATIDKGFGAAAAMAGENAALSKGVAAAQTIYNTQQGIMAAMGATSVADKLLPYPVRLANAIATGVMGAASLAKIMSTDPTGGGAGGGGGGAVSASSGGTPAPQMMSGAFELGGGLEPEPTRAYVVTDEMTSSQNQLANIRRRATI